MSKITNDGLTQSGTGCFIAVHTKHIATVGRQRVKWAVVNQKVWCCNERSTYRAGESRSTAVGISREQWIAQKQLLRSSQSLRTLCWYTHSHSQCQLKLNLFTCRKIAFCTSKVQTCKEFYHSSTVSAPTNIASHSRHTQPSDLYGASSHYPTQAPAIVDICIKNNFFDRPNLWRI